MAETPCRTGITKSADIEVLKVDFDVAELMEATKRETRKKEKKTDDAGTILRELRRLPRFGQAASGTSTKTLVRDKLGRFTKGSGGRPKGSKGRMPKALAESFAVAYIQAGGDAAFAEWGEKNPKEFYKIIAKLVPRAVEMVVPTGVLKSKG